MSTGLIWNTPLLYPNTPENIFISHLTTQLFMFEIVDQPTAGFLLTLESGQTITNVRSEYQTL